MGSREFYILVVATLLTFKIAPFAGRCYWGLMWRRRTTAGVLALPVLLLAGLAKVCGSGDPRITVRYGRDGGPTKNGRPYTVHLIPRATKAVNAWLKLLPTYARKNKRKLLLPLPDGTMRPTDNNRPFFDTWPEHLHAAKIKRPIRWYDLRHTCASSLVSGWSTDERWTLEMVQAYLGHKSRLSTERYAHLGELAMTQAARGDRRVTLRRSQRALKCSPKSLTPTPNPWISF